MATSHLLEEEVFTAYGVSTEILSAHFKETTYAYEASSDHLSTFDEGN